MNSKEILKYCMSKGFLLDKEILELFANLNEEEILQILNILTSLNISERVITKKIFEKYSTSFRAIASLARFNFLENNYNTFEEKNLASETNKIENAPSKKLVRLLSSQAFPQKKVEVKDFVVHFRHRYESLKNILSQRDLEDLTTIKRIGNQKGSYTIIVMVSDKRITKNKNLFLTVEDMTGRSIALINSNKKELFEKAKDLLYDEVVALNVTGTKEMLYVNDIFFPETSLDEKKYFDDDEYVAFCSDTHVGSMMFLEKNLLRFIKWLNGNEGDERQKAVAKKVKYLLLTGDNVDGVGIFPSQEKLLNIQDMKEQYKKLAEFLKLIRKDIQIVIAPGQHDAVWVGEPQPIIGDEWAKDLSEMENVTLVPNPALIELKSGLKILMYHGASMQGIIEEIPEIRLNFGHNCPTRVVKEMLKRRHLAPMHGECDYIPCEKEDPLVIKQVPDIIATGDQHRAEVSLYNNILLIASSCWQSRTPFEEKVGNNPDPCKVPIYNLKTREIKILDFSDGEGLTAEEIDKRNLAEVKDDLSKMELEGVEDEEAE